MSSTDFIAAPPGASAVIPRLVCCDAAAEVDFCTAVFGAEVGVSRPGPDGTVGHAMLLFGSAMVMIEAEWPELSSRAPTPDGSSPIILYVYVSSVDAVLERARTRGAKVLMEPKDEFWGDRIAWFMDPAGHVWTIASRVEETTEGQRRERWENELLRKR